jgi:ankyrin repeat protein/mono/diheme cytochrome c family protein
MQSIKLTIILTGWLICLQLQIAATFSPGVSLFEAIRANDHATVRKLVEGGADLRARDESGNTPLMVAAWQADIEVFKLLLDDNADVNASNSAGITPLMLAATFPEKVRLLVELQADVNARSAIGNTPLMLAARASGSAETLKLLLDHGAEVDPTNKFGATPLMAAVAAEDGQGIRVLLDRGADVNAQPNMDEGGFIEGGGRTPLQWAAFRGNETLLRLLLARGANVNDFTLIGGALTQAAWGNHVAIARILLEAGAEVDQRDVLANFSPLHWAASSDYSSPELVNLLLDHGADSNAEGGEPVDGFLGVAQTPLMLARRRGETPIVKSLLNAGARAGASLASRSESIAGRPEVSSADPGMILAAIQLAVPTLQESADDSYKAFRRHASKQDCISCHQQQLPVAAFGRMKTRNLLMDREGAKRQVEYLLRDVALSRHNDSQPTFHPEPAIGNGYALFGLRLENQPVSAVTDILVHHLATIQSPDGRWCFNLPRPPIQSSDIGATALGIHALRYFGPPGRKRELTERVDRARTWLRQARPETNEEHVHQLLGLFWANEAPAILERQVLELIRQQRPDGGWGQLPGLPSDAYATGYSLFAILESGAVPADHPAVPKGIRHLLRTQQQDGTWHVRRRAFPFQPPMDSGFSHGADGWISGAATSWAVLALATALDELVASTLQTGAAALLKADARPDDAVHSLAASGASVPVDFKHDIQPLLERSCVVCHSGERPKGGFQIVSRSTLVQGGNRGDPVVVANHSERSPLIDVVSDRVQDLEMPPLGKRDRFPALSTDEIARLRAWIDQGAEWPDDVTLRTAGE